MGNQHLNPFRQWGSKSSPFSLEVGLISRQDNATLTLRVPDRPRCRRESGTESSPPLPVIVILNDGVNDYCAFCLKSRELVPNWIFRFVRIGDSWTESVRAALPSAVLMDVDGSGITAIEHVRRLKALDPDLPIVVCSSSSDAASVFLCVMAGANGYLVKPVTVEEILSALSRVIHGHAALCSKAQLQLINCLRYRAHQAAKHMTQREQQIMGCLFQNQSDKEIEQELRMTYGTLHTHLVSIYRKLGVHSRRDAVARFLGLD